MLSNSFVMDGYLTGWWLGIKNLNQAFEEKAWWWTYVTGLCLRLDNINEYRSLHPDNEKPPKEIWLDDDALKAWVKMCDKLRREQSQGYGYG